MMLLSRAFAMRSHEANSGGWAYFGRDGRGDGRAVNIAGGVGRYRWACRGGETVGAHAALEGIFRVKGTDVKDDAANFLHNRSSAVRRQHPPLASGLVYLNIATGGEEPGAVVCTSTLQTSIPLRVIRCHHCHLDRQVSKSPTSSHMSTQYASIAAVWPVRY